MLGACALEATLEMVAEVRSRLGPGPTIVAEGGITEPADALALHDAGASLVELHSGLIFSGPGLPKRINEAFAARGVRIAARNEACVSRNEAFAASAAASGPRVGSAWRWHLLLGLSMIVGGSLAWLVAAVSVTLPYDDAYLGLDRVGLAALSPRILPFMAHDRVTLAGTMISIGVLYSQLAWWGMRRAAHWAWKAVVVSAGVGFVSFFLFLGFGYFDPLHAAVSVVLFGFFVAGLRGRPRGLGPLDAGLRNDGAWWRGLYGQLCFVAIGVGLVLAGLTIAGVGVTTVFVPEDVTFLRAEPDLLRAANAHLLPLIAHDRAGFGGALVSDGLAVLLVALWGFRRGAAWVWWTLLLAGIPGFGAAIGVHAAVGYGDALHLAPVFVAVGLYISGLALSCGYLCGSENTAGQTLRRATRRGATA